jgi:hypothetical protein
LFVSLIYSFRLGRKTALKEERKAKFEDQFEVELIRLRVDVDIPRGSLK